MDGFVASDMGTGDLTATPGGGFLELRRRSEIGLWDGDIWGGGGGLVYRKGELHALNGPGLRILASLATALSFNGTLANEISGGVALKVGSLKFLDAPMEGNRGESGHRAANKTKGRWDGPALFLVEFVAHDLGELFELTLRLGIVRVDNEVLQMPEAPTQVFETLSLLKVAGHLGADLGEIKRG